MTAKPKSGLFLLLALILLLNMATLFSTSTFASSTTYLKILDPVEGDTSLTYTNTAPPPTEPDYPMGYVLVNVSVFDVLNLATWQINITWDPTLLEIGRVNPSCNPDYSDIYIPTDNIFNGWTDPVGLTVTSSSAYLVCGIKLGAPFDHFDGSGALCQIKFNVTKAPSSEGETLSCNIHFVLAGENLFYTKLINPDADLITYTSEDGYYEYAWPPPPPPPSEGAAFYMRPQEIINSSILPPQVIQLNATIKNVTDMYGYGFSLSYDPAILWCISLTILDVLGETNYLPEFSVNNIEGIITVNVTYMPPAVPITTELEVPLVKLMFRVTGIGATLLDINNTNLVDSLGRPIPHAVHDGFFANIIRDLAITNVVPHATWAYQGNILKINVTVRNQGEITETLITVEAYYEGNLLGNDTIASLNPDEQVTLTFAWNTASVTPCQNYTISAEVTAVPYEMDLLNNIYSDGKVKVKLYGDINGDGVVDGQDVQMIRSTIPSYPDHPHWNPEADVNNDGVVDGVDYQQTKKKVGTTC